MWCAHFKSVFANRLKVCGLSGCGRDRMFEHGFFVYRMCIVLFFKSFFFVRIVCFHVYLARSSAPPSRFYATLFRWAKCRAKPRRRHRSTSRSSLFADSKAKRRSLVKTKYLSTFLSASVSSSMQMYVGATVAHTSRFWLWLLCLPCKLIWAWMWAAFWSLDFLATATACFFAQYLNCDVGVSLCDSLWTYFALLATCTHGYIVVNWKCVSHYFLFDKACSFAEEQLTYALHEIAFRIKALIWVCCALRSKLMRVYWDQNRRSKEFGRCWSVSCPQY